jgi:hypothetical protein
MGYERLLTVYVLVRSWFSLAMEDGEPLLPSVATEAIVVDRGKIYLSEHLMSGAPGWVSPSSRQGSPGH